SPFNISLGFLFSRDVPALNIFIAKSSTSILAIFAILWRILRSKSVLVGDLNNSVSEIIAAHKSPATFFVGRSPCSKNIIEIIVQVEPTGRFLKYIGPEVATFATL